ncbi:E3 ubiquitin-protein ligase TRIM71-like [Hyalella azteca]|uniref:E3 ubiquitin-protein ligase TRIM71-like n=1 Tax=Hyalella azteca TaxID=294128 RepID=A0A8B7NGQ7_HYAAZ|nr:E3 ubiquitin-protein ligase TRIM71-like [Hyalella azteca]
MMNGPPDVRSSYKDEDVYKLASQLATFNVSNTSSLALPVDDFQAQFTLGAVGDSSSGYLSGYSDLPSSSGAASKSGSGSSSASLRLGSSYGDYKSDAVQWSHIGASRDPNETMGSHYASFSIGSSSSSYSMPGENDSPPLDERSQFSLVNSSYDPSHLGVEFQSEGYPTNGDFLFDSHMDDDLRQHGNGRKHGSRQRAFDMLTSSKEYLQLGDISTQGNSRHDSGSTYPDMFTSTPSKPNHELWLQEATSHLDFESHEMQNKCFALASMIAQRQNVMKGRNGSGTLNGSLSNAVVSGPGICSAVRGKTSSFQVLFSDAAESPQALKVVLIDPNNHPCALKIKQVSSVAYVVRYKPDFVGVYKASITLNGTHVSGSPCTIMVDAQHKYQAVSYVKAVIEGDLMKTFTFSEPWGVCCDTAGVVFISDRGNHTIRVFKPNYVYSHCIGSHGTMPGELNKPAGITCDDQDHVVVADKDNHRIQVFDIQGQVLLAFGEQGHNCHQLNYPWDVATEPQGSILVTDSRKGRVAIFSGDGIFLRDIGADSQILRNPRGICYRSQDDKIITTDMTKHQIIVLDLTPGNSGADTSLSNHPSLIGRKGSNPNELNRPQGITCDQEGNVIVCDSRNCRIQIFDADANYVNHWPVPSPEPSRQAQPAGVAVTPAGNILVVDAELNRVLIY